MAESPRRILFMMDEISFRGRVISTLRLAQGLQQQGSEIVVLTTGRRPVDPALTTGLRIVEMPGLLTPVWRRMVERSALAQMSGQPPDVIHVVTPRMLAPGLRLAESIDRKLILTVAGHEDPERIPTLNPDGRCAAIICVSRSVREALEKKHGDPDIPLFVVHPGVAEPTGPGLRPPFSTPNSVVIGMAGPLETVKGGQYFLRACHKLRDQGLIFRALIAGEGSDERHLRQLISSLDLTDIVTMVGQATAMQAVFSAMDIYCLPSLQAGIGVTMLEAMAHGRPVAASGVGGVLNVIEDNRTGLLVPPADSGSLASALAEMIADPQRSRSLAEAGTAFVREHFCVADAVAAVSEVYDKHALPYSRSHDTTGARPAAARASAAPGRKRR